MRPARQHRTPPVGDAQELLRGHGCRVTVARRAVLQALIDHHGPLTASRLAELATDGAPGVHEATVYRTISMLADAGIATHVHAGHGPSLVRLSSDDAPVAVCTACGRIDPVPDAVAERLVAEMIEATGFELRLGHFALEGRCCDCRIAS